MKEYLAQTEKVLAQNASTPDGLSSGEAAGRLEKHGPNKLKEGKKESLLHKFLCELADPMTLILLAAALISGITAAYSGESFADVFIILTVVIINAVLGVAQESKAEKAIAALQEIAAATSKVMRDGKQTVVPSAELVPGDVIVLEAGDAVPADARILECASLKVEEAALTGESVPVNKTSEALSAAENGDVPLGDRKNMVYMGSSVVYGRGRAVVTGTGMNTEMGKIADALTNAQKEETPLQQKLNQLSRVLSVLVLGICAVIFALDLIRLYPNFNGEAILDTFMVAVSLAVAAIPEGLAAVVTIVLSIGVTNMSRRNAVIRRLTAVETLGCTQVICSDKTGTLTQNKMTVVEAYGDDDALSAASFALCTDATLAPGAEHAEGDPTQTAVVDFAARLGLPKYELEAEFPRIGEIPFDSGRKLMTTVHKAPSGAFIQHTTGAPDVVIRRCTHIRRGGQVIPLTDDIRAELADANKALADKALRVLAAAYREYDAPPASYDPQTMENELIFLGLAGMIDPIRPEVRDAIAECREAGIRPVMITGDHRDTAVAIARQLGILSSPDEAITGAQLDKISDEELRRDIAQYSVYARVQPEHKVRIVNAWRASGCITAMTGDGVNDAPSIKSADIGVGMGITGTDVTKNVADMVLTDDNFATIVSAVEEGRRIYDNIRKSIQYLLASNLAEVLSIFAATVLGFTILKPVHLLWINLITDCFPALALGMEKSERDVMKRAPRRASDGIFAGGMGIDVFMQGILVTLLTLASYFVGHFMEAGRWEITESADGMTMAFLTLSLVEIFHSFNMRSRRGSIFTLPHQNPWLWGAMAVSLVCTTAVIYVPFLRTAFGFEWISFSEYAVAVGLAVLVIPIMELIKLIQRKAAKNS
ncbi:MAG: cation-translocating P-type ATPase [Eubacteriales bacterium]